MGRTGKLKRRIEIFSPTTTRDSLGGYVTTWTTVGTTWAKVEVDTGNRALEYLQAKNERPYTITIRQDIDVQPNYKIVYNGFDLIINSIDLDEDKYTYQIIRASQKIV